MLDHNIFLVSKNCRLRPMLESDEDQVLALWNQDYVVGNLFMSKTSSETYRKHFELYKQDPRQWRWIIENNRGECCGTTGLTLIKDGIAKSGCFAMWPTKEFLPNVPDILMYNFAFQKIGVNLIELTFVSNNKKIRQYHKLQRGHDTGRRIRKIGSNGLEIELECWEYTKENWCKNQKFHEWALENQMV